MKSLPFWHTKSDPIQSWPDRVQGRESLICLGTALLLYAGVLLLYGSGFSIHHDIAGGALSGRLAMVLGEHFDDYVLFFPPIERMWFTLAAWLHENSGMRLDLIIVIMMTTAVLFGSSLAYAIRRNTVGTSPIFLLASIAVLTVLPILFKNVFGMREHLVAIGLWPYIILRLSDPDCSKTSPQMRMILGVWMGFTLLFKYLYAVVVLLVELADALAQRKVMNLFRIENLVSGTMVFAYLFLWLGIQPENREAIAIMVSAISANLESPLDSARLAIPYICLALAIFLAARMAGASHRQQMIALAITTGAIIVSWAQSRWYTHHEFPIFLAFLVWLWLVHRALPLSLKAVVCGWLAWIGYSEFSNIGYYHSTTATLTQNLEQANISLDNKRIALATLHPSPFNQVIVEGGGLRWTPFVNLAYVPAELTPYDRKEAAGTIAPPLILEDSNRAKLHGQMLSLWEAHPPDAFILDNSTSWPLRHIRLNWKHVLSSDARFGKIFAGYELVHSYNDDDLDYEYYVRKR